MHEERTLGQRIRDARAARGWSQERLADELGTTRQVVLRWEADKHVPQARFIHLLARVFSLPKSHFEPIDELAEIQAQLDAIRERRGLVA